jgi:UrcA family protein
MNMKTSHYLNRVSVACATGLIFASGSVALAQNPQAMQDIPQQRVNFADVNLDSPAGVAKLYRRIESAAEQVCVDPAVRDVRRIAQGKLCLQQAIARAIRQIDLPALTALHGSKSGTIAPLSVTAAQK